MTTSRAQPRFSGLDGLRAIAALSVVVTHTAGLTTFNSENELLGPITARLNVGVTVFFVLSGFLLWRPWVTARLEGRPGPDLRRYARSRVLRIFPAYWLALTLLAVWPGLPGVFGDDWWRFYALVQNLDRFTLVTGLGPAWSLAIEASFYLLLPGLAWLAARALRGRTRGAAVRVELGALLVLGLASVALRSWAHVEHPDGTLPYTLPGTFAWFALGMALATISAGGALPRAVGLVERRPWLAWAGALGVLLALTRAQLPLGFPYAYSDAGFLAEHVGFGLFAVLLVAPAAFPGAHRGPVHALLDSRPLGWLGLVSYGLFLWHLPLAIELNEAGVGSAGPGMLLVTLTTLAVSLVPAAASFYLVERPLLRRYRDPPASGLRRRASASARAAPAASPAR